MDELIVVRQIPIIEDQLRTIKKQIEARVSEVLALECTEGTVKQVKAVRTQLTKDFQELESRRKDVKAAILAPYNAFEQVYKECVAEVYKPADARLKDKIDEVENRLRQQKRAEVEAYFEEYRISKGIDFVAFAQANIEVGLSDSKKSLKERAKAFLDKVGEELSYIASQTDSTEILVEYRKTLNMVQSINIVKSRHEAMDAERQRIENAKEAARQREAAESKIDAAIAETEAPLAAPIAMPGAKDEGVSDGPQQESEQVLRVTFTVIGTLAQLKDVKRFLTEGGYQYE